MITSSETIITNTKTVEQERFVCSHHIQEEEESEKTGNDVHFDRKTAPYGCSSIGMELARVQNYGDNVCGVQRKVRDCCEANKIAIFIRIYYYFFARLFLSFHRNLCRRRGNGKYTETVLRLFCEKYVFSLIF